MKKWISLALIAIMFVSLPAYAFFQGSFNQQSSGEPNETQLPADYVIDYSMSRDQYYYAIDRGFTVATYSYSDGCGECPGEIALLEQVVNSQDFQGQIILEEVRGSGSPKLQIASFAGERTLDSVDSDSVTSALCGLVLTPPISCASG